MDSRIFLLVFFSLCASGSLIGFIVHKRYARSILALAGSLASLLILWISAESLFFGRAIHVALWKINGLGRLTVSIGGISAVFLAVTGLVFLAVSVFSTNYLKRYKGRYSIRVFNMWYLLLFASIVFIFIAADALTFLLGWEMMSIFSYLLVNFEHGSEKSRKAAYLMLSMSEAGFIAVVIAFVFFWSKSGSLEFSAFKAAGANFGIISRWAIFLLTFFGFGVKAGLVPVNTWLPRAHPAAPANISAILSSVILNLGLYGIIRVNFDILPADMPFVGIVVIIVGAVSALLGILYATTENDLKTMLAHSSIENIGIVTVNLGAAIVFSAYGKPVIAAIAFIIAFYHLINHSVYKTLLFLGAGAIDNNTGTRDLNKLGGLIHSMPWVSGAFLIGALSISALPPFNGFVSEWLTLQVMLRSAELNSVGVKLVFILCGVGLALTAALAVTCFGKAFAMGFLGLPRSDQAAKAKKAGCLTFAPMAFLAVLCLLLGILPTYIIPSLGHSLQPASSAAADALVPPFFSSSSGHNKLPPSFVKDFHGLGAQVGEKILPGRGLVVLHRGGTENPVVFAMSTSYMFVVLILLLILSYIIVRISTRKRKVFRKACCWDGGLRKLLPNMTYTATGFSNPVRVIFDSVFRPKTLEDTCQTVEGHFRVSIRRSKRQDHIIERFFLHPMKSAVMRCSECFASMHHGKLNSYAAYVLLVLLLLLSIV